MISDGVPLRPRTTKERWPARCELRLRRHLEFLADTTKPGTPQYYSSLAELAKHDYWLYLRVILGFRWMDPWLHGDVVVDFLENECEWREFMLLLPRGAGKTGAVTGPLPAWIWARDPDATGFLINAVEDKAKNYSRVSAGIVEKNALYQACFPEVIPNSKRWKLGEYYLDRGASTERTDPSLAAYGALGNVTGFHGRFGLMDDLINLKISESRKEMLQINRLMHEVSNLVDDGGMFGISGTRWKSYDMYGQVLRAEIAGRSGKPIKVLKLGAEREVKGADGEFYTEIIWPSTSYIDLAGAKQKLGYTPEFLDSKKRNDPNYSGQYQNEPTTDLTRTFATESINTFKSVHDLPGKIGNVVRMAIECEGGGPTVIASIKKDMRVFGRIYRMTPVVNSRRVSKHDRIRAAVSSVIANGYLHVIWETWKGSQGLGQELRDFNDGDDDALDSLVHCMNIAKPSKNPEELDIYLGMDLAFSEKLASDHTCILAGGYMGEDFYVVGCVKYRTKKTEVHVRRIAEMWKRFEAGGLNVSKREKVRRKGFRSIGDRGRSRSSWFDRTNLTGNNGSE